jgi:hypothetical protein
MWLSALDKILILACHSRTSYGEYIQFPLIAEELRSQTLNHEVPQRVQTACCLKDFGAHIIEFRFDSFLWHAGIDVQQQGEENTMFPWMDTEEYGHWAARMRDAKRYLPAVGSLMSPDHIEEPTEQELLLAVEALSAEAQRSFDGRESMLGVFGEMSLWVGRRIAATNRDMAIRCLKAAYIHICSLQLDEPGKMAEWYEIMRDQACSKWGGAALDDIIKWRQQLLQELQELGQSGGQLMVESAAANSVEVRVAARASRAQPSYLQDVALLVVGDPTEAELLRAVERLSEEANQSFTQRLGDLAAFAEISLTAGQKLAEIGSLAAASRCLKLAYGLLYSVPGQASPVLAELGASILQELMALGQVSKI